MQLDAATINVWHAWASQLEEDAGLLVQALAQGRYAEADSHWAALIDALARMDGKTEQYLNDSR